jgi:hypothetical protein
MKALFFTLAILTAFLSSCNAPPIPEPVLTSIQLEAPDTCLIMLDGLEFGYGSMSLIVIENYPNYLQVGSWKFVILPPVKFDIFKVE